MVDPDNWEWRDESISKWEVAVENWQAFNTIWYGASAAQCASLHDSRSPFLALGPLAATVGLTSILVRECYVTMVERIWSLALWLDCFSGVVLTGQPGIGAYFFSTFTLVIDNLCL